MPTGSGGRLRGKGPHSPRVRDLAAQPTLSPVADCGLFVPKPTTDVSYQGSGIGNDRADGLLKAIMKIAEQEPEVPDNTRLALSAGSTETTAGAATRARPRPAIGRCAQTYPAAPSYGTDAPAGQLVR
jgi:hypothetical protein